MGAFDRIQSYSSRRGLNESSPVFDVTKPEGAFLNRVHREGYAMCIVCYRLKPEFRLDDETLESLDDKSIEDYEKSLKIGVDDYNALDADAQATYEEGYEFTELHDALTTGGNQVINAIAGSGKCELNGTGVLTTSGYVPIESLRVGDLVFAEDGNPYNVLGVYPRGNKLAYEVSFSDGNTIICGDDHLWNVDFGKGWETLSTKDLLGRGKCNIPMQDAVEFCTEDVDLPVEPYLLGVLLSDADLMHDKIAFVEHDDSIINNINSPDIHRMIECEYGVDKGSSILIGLKDLGLLGVVHTSKFIPDCYLFASVNQRYHLLMAFLDTCSDWDSPYYDYSTVSKKLADGVTFLAESLGLVVISGVRNINGSSVYSLKIQASERFQKLHSCDRLDNIWDSVGEFSERYITDVKVLDYEAEMTCIEVDSPSHLYLTEHCIPTHNTTSLVFKILHDIVTGEAMTVKAIPNGSQVRVVNNMWVCTFLRSGAAELEQSLTGWQKKLGYSQTANQIVFSTMDAEFKRCLNAMGVATPIGDASKLMGLLKKAVDSCNILRNGRNLSKEDYQIISGIVVYYRGRLDDKKYQHPSCSDYDLTPTILDLVVKQYASLRHANGIMDFEEIMELMYQYLYVTPNPAVQDFVANRYNYIYIDEFQDTSQMAYAILKFYARGHLWMNADGREHPDVGGLYTGVETLGKLVVVGDPSQCMHPESGVINVCGACVNVRDVQRGDSLKSFKGSFERVTGVNINRYDGRMVRIKTETGSVSVTPSHVFFELLDDVEMNVQNTVIFYLGGKDFSHIFFASDGSKHTFKSKEDIDAYIHGGRYEGVDYLYCFNNYCYREINAIDIVVSKSRLAMYENGKVVPKKVLGMEFFDYDGQVYDVNTNDHVYITEGCLLSHNCIYSFRGSDSTLFTKNIDEDFRPCLNTLSINWRCPSKILNPIVPSIHKNWDSASQNIIPANEGGEFTANVFSSYKLMIQKLKEDVMKDMDDNYRVGILCRTNFDGLIPAFVLEADGRFDFGISGENMTLSSPLPKKIIGVTSLFTERCTPAVKNALAFFIPRGREWDLKRLMDILKANNISIWQIPKADLDYSCGFLSDFIFSIKSIIMPDGVTRDKSKEMEALRAIYTIMITDTFAGDSAYCESARAYLETLLYLIESNDFKTIFEFIEEIEFLNDKLNGRIKKTKAPIQIATVHEFKGKERDSIYVWNDSDGTFPSSKCDVEVQEQLDEERRVHYIACTRAKKREHIYTLRGKESMFVREMDLKLEPVSNTSVSLPKH